MNTKERKINYVEWLSPEEMHDMSIQWFSELMFIKDEQLFLNNLIKSYTIQLTDKGVFEKSRELVAELLKAEKEVVSLLKKVQLHSNQLEIMVDDVDQLKMEKAYKATHNDLLLEVNAYGNSYRNIKERMFKLVSKVMKLDKQKRLLN
ncbi:hypothetical protein SB49_03120 [Sediminicola sp. YIK13]|uniref:hypothetical protein n=1 Tax=Sediminicola sp. YIK13 TaxID=1453352 RepID=UPI000720259F|nr:hypothetical protein [Sediminicola sp. YIK13]ALM06905.1 hypothetical protein SB49_03120 [Sediminicola sp. YIK13]